MEHIMKSILTLAASAALLATPLVFAASSASAGPVCKYTEVYAVGKGCKPRDPVGAGARLAEKAVETAFRDDCAAKGGTVYTAEVWNSKSGANLPVGALHCNREARWVVDN